MLKLATAAQQWPLDILRFLEAGLPGTRISWTSWKPDFPELKIVFEMTPRRLVFDGATSQPPVALAAHVLSFFVPPTTPSDEQRRSPLNICF